MKNLLTFILLTICLANVSCGNKTTPAGFWIKYKAELLKKNISDQGPYGGHRAMYWKSESQNTFTAKQVIDFATKNSWTLVDSI